MVAALVLFLRPLDAPFSWPGRAFEAVRKLLAYRSRTSRRSSTRKHSIPVAGRAST